MEQTLVYLESMTIVEVEDVERAMTLLETFALELFVQWTIVHPWLHKLLHCYAQYGTSRDS